MDRFVSFLGPHSSGSRRYTFDAGRFSIGFLLLLGVLSAAAQDVTTWHYDVSRSGVQPNETLLTPANVNSAQFGKVFSFPVQGDVYAQPLYLGQYTMADGLKHNVLIVATAEDYVYAFDADGNNPPQGYLWCDSLLGSGETWVLAGDVGTVDINPNIGIIGTPVIDRSGGTIYVVAASKTTSSTPAFYQRLHALNIADGAEKLNGPTVIQGSVWGSGDGGSAVTFNPLIQNQRAALLLAPTPGLGSGTSVVIAWGSHGDKGSYHGWLMAYDAANIAQQNGVWATTPNATGGGIWMSGGGPSADGLGNIYAAGGNGQFDAATGGSDYGDSAFRIALSPTGPQVADSFTPADQLSLDTGDHDMGMSAVILLPTQSVNLPNLAITTDKSGTLYLLNRDNLGGYAAVDTSVQSLSTGFHIHSSGAFFNNMFYLGLDNGPLEAWTLDPEHDELVPQSATSTIFTTPAWSGGGGTPSISANGTSNAIAWIVQATQYNYGPAVLHAYNAADLTQELYNSTQAAQNRDTAAIAVKFVTPTIANGHVYVGGRSAVTVYGLLSSYEAPAAAPTMQPAPGTYATAQTVTLTSTTPNASIYYTTNGDAPTTNSTLYTEPIEVANSQTIEAIAIAPGYTQSSNSVGSYTILPPPPATGPSQVQVPLSAVANSVGILTDGSKLSSAGLDGAGRAYSANQLGTSVTLFGIQFTFGTPNQNNAIRGAARPTQVALPAGQFNNLEFLGTAIGANQNGVVFSVTYSDGSTQSFTQNMSAWTQPEHHSGESLAYSGTYYDSAAGTETKQAVYLYRYSFALNPQKSVLSFSIPANSNIAVLAISLYRAQGGSALPVVSTPVMQPAAGAYSATQTVTLTDATPNAAIYYTTNGQTPSASSTLYTGPIQVAASETIRAIAIASGSSPSDMATGSYTIGQPAVSAGQVQVPLAAVANAVGLFTDGRSMVTTGLDGAGHGYSADELGSGLTLFGIRFTFGAANQPDAILGAADTVLPLPAGNFKNLEYLGAAMSNQNGVVFTVTYTDGTTQSFTQNMSGWTEPKYHSGESTAYSGAYYDASTGESVSEPVYLYRYSFALNTAKTVRSLTMPANDRVAVLAVTLYAK